MHIAYLCNEYPPVKHGGIGTFVQLMARQLVVRGHQVSVIGACADYAGPRLEDDRGVQVYRAEASGSGVANTVRNQILLAHLLIDIHRRCPVEILEGSELSFGLLPWLPSCPRIIRIHGGHVFFSSMLGKRPRFWTRQFERWSFARASHLCAVSRFAGDTTRRLLVLGSRAIEVLPNPVDTDVFRPYPEIHEEEGLVCFTGSLREKKGVRQLIQAMPAVVKAVPSARLWLQGPDVRDTDTGGSMRERLEGEIPPEIRSRISFCGQVPNDSLPQRNARASVLVYPSWMETQGIVVVEGMASGKAVIASRTGPGPELIDHGVSGLLCDPKEPESIAESLVACLRKPELRRALGRAARQTAVDRFSLPVLMDKNERFYQRCRS